MDSSDIAFAGAATQARMLADGELTAPELLEIYLERIARLDSELRAYRVVLTDKARDEASAAQDRLDAGERLPLLGVPVAVKDDVDVAGEVTTYGGSAHGPAATADAEAVRRLRAAGAVIIGKTSVPELMIMPFTESLALGATRNPWNPSRTPGGSSGGSAAAVAAGLAAVALGSDGGGSIRIPSTWCGLFGLKPQRDRISLEPHDGAWQGLSVNGPIARSVRDAALMLDATAEMSGVAGVPGPEGEFAAAAERDPGRLRIALSTKVPTPLPVRVGKQQLAAVEQAGALLRELGHDVIIRDPEYPPLAYTNYLPRFLRGISDDADAQAHPERLERRTRVLARLGSCLLGPEDGRLARRRAGAGQEDPVDLRRRRRRRHAGQRHGPVPHRRLPAQGWGVDAVGGGAAGSLPTDLEPDRTARGGGAVGLRRRRAAAGGAARRPSVRRGHAVVAVRTDRSRTTVGPPATAGVVAPLYWRRPASPGCAALAIDAEISCQAASLVPGGMTCAGLVDGSRR